MDFGLQSVPRSAKGHKKSYKGKRKNNDSLKVVYISSPMKVKTSASRFRSLVQQLTGKHSDITQYIESNTNWTSDFYEIGCDEDEEMLAKEGSDHQVFSSISSEDTPTTSDSLLGPMDNAFIPHMEEQFAGIFSSDSFRDHSQLDVLGSYDELL